jgi:putative ABC transport system permease protein
MEVEMERFAADLRQALRVIRQRPALSAIVIGTLAVGIGFNTAIFSVVHAVLLKPLPYPNGSRLVVLTGRNVTKNLTQQPLAYVNVIDWRDQNQVFENVAAVRGESMSLTSQTEPERIAAVRVSVSLLSALGVKPLRGRDFRSDEDQPANAQVALISHGFWQRHGANPDIIGEKLTLDGRSYSVVGVLPAWLKQPGLSMSSLPPTGAEVWIPLVPAANEVNRNFANMRVVAELRPGVTLHQARSEMDALAARLAAQYPDSNSNLGVEVTPLHEHLTGRARRALWILLAAVGCVLLIACANVASLLLARAAERRTEMAVRISLGASRMALVRQLLTECVVLSLCGGVLGALLAYNGVSLISSINVASIPRVEEISLDRWVLLFTLALSVLCGVAFGIAPAILSSRVPLTELLKEGKRGSAGNLRSRRVLEGLVVAEIAVALVLLTTAGLMMRSFRSVISLDPGFDLANVLTFSLPLPPARYSDQKDQLLLFEKAINKLRTIPGVEAVAGTFRVPVTGFATAIFTTEGKPVPYGSEPSADYRAITPDYFNAMGMKLRQGRSFTDRDAAGALEVVVINEELARRYWPNENAIGKRLQIATERTRWREVAGVVENAKLSGPEAPTDPAIYVPFAQNTWPNALRLSSMVVRSSTDPHGLILQIRSVMREIDPGLPLSQLRTMEEILADSTASRKFNTVLFAAFAVAAGVLAVVGIYGLMSYTVSQRTHELGIRMALGAGRFEILRMVTNEGARLTASGIVAGTLLSLVSTRLVKNLLFGVGAADPATFVAMALSCALAAFTASYIPARRAARTDPMVAIRGE